MTTPEEAQQTKWRATVGVAIVVCLCIVISIGIYMNYAYPDASVTPRVIKQQQAIDERTQWLDAKVKGLEKQVTELEKFKKDIVMFLELKRNITQ